MVLPECELDQMMRERWYPKGSQENTEDSIWNLLRQYQINKNYRYGRLSELIYFKSLSSMECF